MYRTCIWVAVVSQKKVLFIMGSTRAGRNCPRITAWVRAVGSSQRELAGETIDLADWILPMDDEPGIPALGAYAQAHTRAWSEKIKAADAVVLVTPQFNWGYPAVLKNAIDHLYHEWRDKPVLIVTYGGHAGGRCASQLRQVAAGLKMRVVPTAPGLRLPDAVIRQGAELDPDRDFAAARGALRQAFGELTDAMAGRERLRARLLRRWQVLRAMLG
ncbi:NADPH-dependent FMN reductase [Frateuria aurantia]